MRDPYTIILKPVLTEKSLNLAKQNKYVFEVAKDANKIEIGKAVEEIFKVKVKSVAVINEKPKRRRLGISQGFTSTKKKAIVTLEPGYKIELISGV
ncbi:50S ribosomal protein L23 [Dictyoglomus thermophilum]|uniref:Large ribosomal subunit protein uL23 n=2 Tax=Dictyoglomus thermophilum TaxID=14 RepID=B5YDU5_DICT6|nr:50S ribosomal protein L23 [Dictyoglomus thermophilum]ACI19875.1 ribosomal protein L23 [Dictyoglomus thermophilum H-6-12]MCX7721381.1 50S ribosomal protein L23 [Dictyoglomus thermophilum]TYT21008.1 50S ribosomal protein L23 [Dictyoglomus thermophilum]